MTKALFKTTIVIWSEEAPSGMSLEDIAREADEGSFYCSSQETLKVEKPAYDPEWDGSEFFDLGDDEDEDETEASPHEVYQTLVLSMANLSKKDNDFLCLMSEDKESMVYSLEYGLLVKLYDFDKESPDLNHKKGLSKNFHKIIKHAEKSGYRAIEFDRDAEVSSLFESFDW